MCSNQCRGGIHFASDPSAPETDESVGELLPNLEAKVVDNTGRIVAKNEIGEIWIKNPFVMTAYWNNPEETNEAFSSDGWIKTGDLGRVNEKNRWYICGRKKVKSTSLVSLINTANILQDLFKVQGRHIPAARIELAILAHPEIVDVAVVPVILSVLLSQTIESSAHSNNKQPEWR